MVLPITLLLVLLRYFRNYIKENQNVSQPLSLLSSFLTFHFFREYPHSLTRSLFPSISLSPFHFSREYPHSLTRSLSLYLSFPFSVFQRISSFSNKISLSLNLSLPFSLSFLFCRLKRPRFGGDFSLQFFQA